MKEREIKSKTLSGLNGNIWNMLCKGYKVIDGMYSKKSKNGIIYFCQKMSKK